MPVLKYLSGGSYVPLPGGIEEVTISPNQPPVPTDLWIDTDDDSPYLDSILSGFRNVIRNGDMSIAQRGNGPFTSGYTVDGWALVFSGGTCTLNRTNSINVGSRLVVATSGQSAGHYTQVWCYIEDVDTLNGQPVTLSFLAKAASGTPTIGARFIQNFGSGGSPSSGTTTNFTSVPISAAWARYSTTVEVPTTAGKTLGTTAGTDHVQLRLVFSGVNEAIQNNTIEITDVQLEAGSVATPFERLPQQQQLAWCQRYFYKIGPVLDDVPMAMGPGASTSSAAPSLTFPVTMRATPSFDKSAVGTFMLGNGGSGAACTAVNMDFANATGARLGCTVSGTPLGIAQTITLARNGSNQPYLAFSAEF